MAPEKRNLVVSLRKVKIQPANFQKERAHKADMENWNMNGLPNTGKCRGDGYMCVWNSYHQITTSIKKKFVNYLDGPCIWKGNSKAAEGGTRNFIKLLLDSLVVAVYSFLQTL